MRALYIPSLWVMYLDHKRFIRRVIEQKLLTYDAIKAVQMPTQKLKNFNWYQNLSRDFQQPIRILFSMFILKTEANQNDFYFVYCENWSQSECFYFVYTEREPI